MKKKIFVLCLVVVNICMMLALTGCEQQAEPPQTSKPAPSPTVPRAEELSQTSKPAPSPTVPGAKVAFSDKLPTVLAGLPPSPGGPCTVDHVNDSLATAVNKVSAGSSLNMDGWAVDGKAVSVPKIVVVQLTSIRDNAKVYALASRGVKRPDVAKALNNSVYEDAGFYIKDAFVNNLSAGQYAISVIQVSGNTALVCDAGKKVDVE